MIACKPVRILHVLDTLGKGGLETGLVNLIHALDSNSFEHVVCTIRALGENAERLPAGRVKLICLRKTDRDSSFQIPTLVRIIRQVRPDIVHSRNWGALESVIAARFVRPCSTVHSEHGLDSMAAGREARRRICFRRIAYRLAHRVVTVSHSLKDVHVRNTGISAKRIAVIHNGVDYARFAPNAQIRNRVRDEFAIPEDTFCIGAVGSLFPVKDHLTLLKAVRRLNKIQLSWRLLIIGEGPERANLEKAALADPGCCPRIIFMGASNRVAELMQAMDAYVLPSISEGVSNSLLEAMSTGLPSIATASGGTPEVITHGESGLLFSVSDDRKLADHLLLLFGDRERRARLGRAAVARVRQHFSLDSMATRYKEVYLSLMSHSGRLSERVETA